MKNLLFCSIFGFLFHPMRFIDKNNYGVHSTHYQIYRFSFTGCALCTFLVTVWLFFTIKIIHIFYSSYIIIKFYKMQCSTVIQLVCRCIYFPWRSGWYREYKTELNIDTTETITTNHKNRHVFSYIFSVAVAVTAITFILFMFRLVPLKERLLFAFAVVSAHTLRQYLIQIVIYVEPLFVIVHVSIYTLFLLINFDTSSFYSASIVCSHFIPDRFIRYAYSKDKKKEVRSAPFRFGFSSFRLFSLRIFCRIRKEEQH